MSRPVRINWPALRRLTDELAVLPSVFDGRPLRPLTAADLQRVEELAKAAVRAEEE